MKEETFESVMTGLPEPRFKDVRDLVAIDVSGSMDAWQWVRGLSIAKALDADVILFDTEVVKEYEAGDTIDLPVKRGGGTDFKCVWDYAKKYNVPSVTIVSDFIGL